LRANWISGYPLETARSHFSEFNLSGIILNNARLHTADLSGTILEGAKLNGAFLSYSNTDNINLRNAQLKNSKFWWANFKNIDLSYADFSGANLNGSEFIKTNLESAKFNGADLHEAKFIGCNLNGVEFKEANLKYALFEKNEGISAEEKSKLKRQTSRWRFEVIQIVSKFLEQYYFLLYIFFILSTVTLAIVSKKKLIHKSKVWSCTTVCNTLLAIPLICFVFLTVSGTGTVVQFNVGSSIHMHFWSLWVGVFMPMYIGSTIIFILSLISMIFLVVSLLKKHVTQYKKIFVSYMLSSTCLSFMSLYTLMKFMPTA